MAILYRIFPVRAQHIENRSDLVRCRGEIWPMVKHCLLRCSQLINRNNPVHLYDQQRPDPDYRILCGLQGCNDWTEICQ